MRRLVAVGSLVAAISLVLTSCAASPPPSYDEVHDEAVAAMEEVVGTLPADSVVEDLSNDPYPCDAGSGSYFDGEGQFFTGHWAVYPPHATFDGEAFIDALPDELGDDWVVDENAIEMSIPSVRISNGETSMTVAAAVDEDGGRGPYIDILAISRCGAAPAP